MRSNDLTVLDVKPRRHASIFDYLLSQVKGKNILNVGAAGGVHGYLPHNRDIWLHHRLGLVAKELTGVDIDSDGIAHAKNHGVEILNENCESMSLDRRFDVIVLSDVIEHLNAPVIGVSNLMRHLAPGGKLLVTTPNPTALNLLVRTVLYRQLNVYWDHVGCFMPEHIQVICDRYGFKLKEIVFFDHVDRRNVVNKIKSHLAITATKINPRLATSFLAVIENPH